MIEECQKSSTKTALKKNRRREKKHQVNHCWDEESIFWLSQVEVTLVTVTVNDENISDRLRGSLDSQSAVVMVFKACVTQAGQARHLGSNSFILSYK